MTQFEKRATPGINVLLNGWHRVWGSSGHGNKHPTAAVKQTVEA